MDIRNNINDPAQAKVDKTKFRQSIAVVILDTSSPSTQAMHNEDCYLPAPVLRQTKSQN